MYRIKLDEACTEFSLYQHGTYIASRKLVGTLLKAVAMNHGIDISFCQSESHIMAVLQETIDIEVEDV